jgi:multiple sugar transport system substrate-binding protein
VLFANAPRWRPDGPPGSVLGGTGLAISRHSPHRAAAADHLRQISSERAQLTVVPQVGGQPAAASAWSNARIDDEWNGFYGATLETQLTAWRRPRYDGWIRLQHDGSIALFEAISRGESPSRAISALNRLYRDSRVSE